MGEWLPHDGRGVPPDAKPGITICRFVAFPGKPLRDGMMVLEDVWGGDEILWDWSRYGRPAIDASGKHGFFPKITHYKNPSTDAAVEALKALADNPKRKVKEAMGCNNS